MRKFTQTLKALSLMMTFFMVLSSCKDDRDVQDSLNANETAVLGPLRSATMFADLDFSMEAPALDIPEEESLRSLKFKLTSKLNDLAQSRTMEYEYDDGEKVDALLILRCTGLTVNSSETNQTPKDMPYLYSFVKLSYHTKNGCTHKYPETSPKKGQAIDGGHFICDANEIKFSWHGPSFEEIKENTNGRQWQVRVFLNRRIREVKPDEAGAAPKSLAIPVGDEEKDRTGKLDENLSNDKDESRKRLEPVDLYDLYIYDETETAMQNIDKLAKDTDVPFMSEWSNVEFTLINHEGKPVQKGEDSPYYSFNVSNKLDGSKGAHIRLRPRGVFVLVDMSTANTTPFEMVGRGIHIQTSAFSFAGKYDFSEVALKRNNGEPEWQPSTTFLLPGQKDDVLAKEYVKDFQFAESSNPGVLKEITYPKKTAEGKRIYALFWLMPNDIKGAKEEDYHTQMYLTSHFGKDIFTGNLKPTSSAERNMFIQTNYNIRKVLDGQVAAIMPARPFVDHNGVSHNFTAEQILQGASGPAGEFIKHGVVGNRRVWLQLPSIKNFPLYTSNGKCAFKSKLDESGNKLPFKEKTFTDEGETISYGKEGDLKHGRILYAKTQNVSRPPIFLEYMGETPCVNTNQIDDQREAAERNGTTGPKAGEEGNYWAENSVKFPYNGGEHYELLASRMNNHWNLFGPKGQSNFQPTGDNFMRADEFHFNFDDAQRLARENIYGYIKHLPKSIAMGTYFRETMTRGDVGRVLTQEQVPSPIYHGSDIDEQYYFIRFVNGANTFVLQDNGDDKLVTQKALDVNNDAQKWQFLVDKGIADPRSEMVIRNKQTGRFLSFRNYTGPGKDGVSVNGKFVLSVGYNDLKNRNETLNETWKIQQKNNHWELKSTKMASDQALNAYQRVEDDKEVSSWFEGDGNNAITFVRANDINTLDPGNQVTISNRSVGPYKITQNFPSRIGYETEDKFRPTYVYRGNADGTIYYAVRYMDHADGKTCTDGSRPTSLHEDGDWKKCNRRRCVVRYEAGRKNTEEYRKTLWGNSFNHDWVSSLANRNEGSESCLYSITARYVGQVDGMAQAYPAGGAIPQWATEKFWQYNNVDDIVRYYTGYGYMFLGEYKYAPMFSYYWTSQPSLPGNWIKVANDVMIMSCSKMVSQSYGNWDGGHAYACSDTVDKEQQDRIGFYLFMDIKDWTDTPTGFTKNE